MKNVFFLFLAVILFACGGVGKYKASVDALAANWDSTTTAVTDFSTTLNNDLGSFSKMAADLRFDDATQKKLTAEQTTAWQSAQSAFAQALQSFAPIRTQVAEFTKAWTVSLKETLLHKSTT
jgi:hypothetical protein